MASYTRAYDEASPADTDKAGKGAEDIRHFKVDIKERLDDIARGEKRLSWNNLDNTSLPTIVGGSWIDIAGDYIRIVSLLTPTDGGVASGTIYIKIVDATTATVTVTAPVWSDTYHGWYGVGASADHRYVMVLIKDGTSYTDEKDLEPVTKKNYIKYITASETWVAPFSGFFSIKMVANGGAGGAGGDGNSGKHGGGGGGGSGAIGYVSKYIAIGASWTSVFNTGSGADTTFSDGTTTLTVPNGTVGSQYGSDNSGGKGGAGGALPSGFDHAVAGDVGSHGFPITDSGAGGTRSGNGGGGSHGAEGGYGGVSVTVSTSGGNSSSPGGGGGGGGAKYTSLFGGTYAGGTGGTALIRITG